MKTHTVLPWTLDKSSYSWGILSKSNKNYRIATMCVGIFGDMGRENEANAEFIIVAVNNFYPMLRALKFALSSHEGKIILDPWAAVKDAISEAERKIQ